MGLSVEKGGAVALIVTESEQVLVVPDKIEENSEKYERPGWLLDAKMEAVNTKRQFAGGVQGEGEDRKATVIREAVEETGLHPDPEKVQPLGVSTLIFHKRLGDVGKYYGVELFTWQIDSSEEAILRNMGAVDASEAFAEMRPRDQIALMLYFQVMHLVLPEFVKMRVGVEV